MASIKQKSKEKQGLVINTLMVRKLNRNVLDVGQWRTALKAADSGRRFKLYELYEDILLDGVLSDAIEKRINAITNAELVFMKDGEPMPEMVDLIDSPVMEEILTEIMNSRFWGKTVLELDFMDSLQVYNIPRAHLRPELGLITVNPGEDWGTYYRGDDFFLEAGKDKDFGLLMKAAPYAIFKRGGVSDWAQFCELFGIPLKVGKYSAQDEASREALQKAFEEAGSAAWLTHPKETEVEVVESSTRGDGNLFNNFRKACNEEILITVLGQTMTTTDGSSRAQSKTHKEVEEDINKADRRFVRRILNTELVPRLIKRGWKIEGGTFTFPETAETLSKTDMIDIHDKFTNKLNLEIDADWLYDYYGIPKPKNGQARKKDPDKKDPVPEGKKDEKKEKLAEDLEREQKTFFEKIKERLGDLLSFFVLAPERSGAAKISGGQPLTALNLSDLPAFDSEALAKRATGGTAYFDPDLFNYTASSLTGALKAGFADQHFAFLGIEYGYTPDALKTAMEMNLFHFSAGKTLAEVQELNEAFRKSTGWPDFLSRAKEISSQFNEVWLRTEYDTAYLTAESSAAYYRLIAQKDIFPFWQYITMDDGKVREEHIKLHGLVLECTDKLWDKIYPPNGWRCRCRVKPMMKHEAKDVDPSKERAKVEEFFKTEEWKRSEAMGWGVNRAKIGEVFTANQHYIRKFPTKAASYLDKLTAEKWNLEALSKIVAAVKEDLPVFTRSAADVVKEEAVEGTIKLSLFNSRTAEISSKEFARIASRSERTKLWKAAKETLRDPDEVWLNDDGSKAFDNFSALKFYKGRAMAVNYRVEKGRLVIQSWDELAAAKASRDKKRRGLLVWQRTKK